MPKPVRARALWLAVLWLAACTTGDGFRPPGTFGFVVPTEIHQQKSEVLYHLMVGELYSRRGDIADSLEHYARAAEISDDAEVVGAAFVKAVEQGDFALSHRLANKYLRLGGEQPDYREILAVVYTVADDINMAESQLRNLSEVERNKSFFFARLADLLMKVKPAVEATQSLAALVSRFPDEVAAQSALATLAMKSHEYEVAQQAAENVIRLSPEDHRHHFIKARSLIQRGKLQEGIATARAHARAARKHFLTRINFARLLFENRKTTQAQEELVDMLSIWPNNPEVIDKLAVSNYQLGVIGTAGKYFSRLLEYPVYEDKANYYLGQIALQQGNFQAAIERFREVHQGQYFRSAQSAVIETLKKQQKVDLLSDYFVTERARQSSESGKATLYLLEGNELLVSERKEESYQLLQKATMEFPLNVDLLYFQGIIAAELGMRAAAKKDFNLVIQLAPNHYDALNALGYMYADDKERLPEARRLVERAYRLRMDSSEILDSMGWVEFRIENFEKAEYFIRLSLSRERNPIVIGHLVEILLARERIGEAQEELSRGLAEFPDSEYLRRLVVSLRRSALKEQEPQLSHF